MKRLRKFFFKRFKFYRVLERTTVSWETGDWLIRKTANLPESQRWVLAEEEDHNQVIGIVKLCRRERITE